MAQGGWSIYGQSRYPEWLVQPERPNDPPGFLGTNVGGGGGLPFGNWFGGSNTAAPAATSAAGAGASAAGPAAAAGGSSFWGTWGPTLAGLAGAGLGYLDAEASGGPSTSTYTPWGPSVPYRQQLLGEVGNLLNGFRGLQPPPPGFGGGGGGWGLGGGTQSIMDQILGNLGGMTDQMGIASGVAQNYFANGNPTINHVMGMMGSYQDPWLGAALSQSMSGSIPGLGQPLGLPNMPITSLLQGGSLGGLDLNALLGSGTTSSGAIGSPNIQSGLGMGPMMARILSGEFLGDNEIRQGLIDSATRPVLDRLNEVALPALGLEGEMTGRQGSSTWNRAIADAVSAAGGEMGDIAAQLAYQDQQGRWGDLLQAMGIIGSQNSQLAGINASMANAGIANQSRDQQARLGFLSDLLGMGSNESLAMLSGALGERGRASDATLALLGMNQAGDHFRLGQMGQLAGLDSDFRLGAGAQLPGLLSGPLYGSLAAFDPFYGVDRDRNEAAAAAAQQRRQQWFQNQQFPLVYLTGLADLINQASGGFGQTVSQGPQQSPWAAALAGGLGAYSTFAGGRQG